MNPSPLFAQIRLPLPDFTLEVDLRLVGGVTAILGPSGSGKTTLLETLAGLRCPLETNIKLGGRVLEDSAIQYCLPPEERRVGYLPQDVLLFPHLTVRRNIAYGAGRIPRGSTLSFRDVVEALEIGRLLDEMPSRLSGGERQRVGLARALLSGAEWLLLDEPLSALDGDLKGRILPYLRRIRERFDIPILYVTHDLTDILTLADEVLVLDKGRVALHGKPMEVLTGVSGKGDWEGAGVENLLEGIVEDHSPERGLTGVRVGEALLWIPRQDIPIGAKAQVSFSAEDVLVSTEMVRGLSARNLLKGRVETVVPDGSDLLRGWAGFPILARLTRGSVAELGITEGREVYFILKSGSIRCVPEEGGGTP